MNDDRGFDCLIDRAARQMAQREPSAELSRAVMARVAGRPKAFARRGLLWGTAGAVALGAVVMLIEISQPAPITLVPAQDSVRPQSSGFRLQGAALVARGSIGVQGSALGVQDSGLRAQDSGLKAHGSGAQDVSQDSIGGDQGGEMAEPIRFDVITPPPIEVDLLQVEAAPAIEPVEIAPIPIEPISSSN
jgi:hypothetical protein